MAFLAPLAAGAGTVGATAGAAALAKAAGAAATASSALGAGITAGAALGGVGLKAGAGLLAPTLGATLPGAVSAGGAGLAGLGGMGLKAGAGAFLPKFASLGGGGGSLLTGGGLGGALTPTGLASLQMPAGSLLKSGTLANMPLAGGSQLAGQAGNISNQMYNQLVQQFGRPGVGQNLTQVGSKLAGPPDLASGTNYLLNAPPKELVSLDLSQGANLANAVKSGGLRMPTGVDAGLRLTPEAAQSVLAPRGSPIVSGQNFLQNAANFFKNPSLDAAGDYLKEHPYASAGAAYMAYNALQPKPKQPVQDKGMIRPYEFAYNPNMAAYATSPTTDSREQLYFSPEFTAQEPYKAAEGGLMGLAVGGPVETMSAMNAVGGNMMYPQSQLQTPLYSNPLVQRPEAVNVISPSGGPAVGAYTGEQKFASGGDTKEPKTTGEYKYSYDPKTFTMTQLEAPRYADTTDKKLPPLYTGPKTAGGIAPPVGGPGIAALMPQRQAAPLNIPAYQSPEERLGLTEFYPMMNRRLAEMGGYAAGGGVSHLGDYSDGGRLLKGPGDGVSDSIPAVIGNRQPARLADGEFVVPARIVSELGNGSTEAGARKLYAMMDRVQKARRKTVGKNKVAANTKADRHLPA